ncbi:ABC transporter substrate-binding protein [Sphingomonas sp. AX6]|uniref:ABC transporter substrate-binding protein n=1 Tax=Sphingomonas sp. AX6 TaxID=2653171 RepID=UPI001F2E40BE|nr:ABC transporter substrate-binding protein [Sphingomonas sp. AX6]
MATMLTACAPQPSVAPNAPERPMRIVSLDYCADQYVLKLVGRDRIAAVSPDADRDFSYMRAAAVGLPSVRPRAEDVLVLKPDLVIRSYGGGADAAAMFARAGVPVLQIGYANDLTAVRQVLVDTARGLDEGAKGEVLAVEMDRRLAAIPVSSPQRPSALYVTPGGVTSGPGGLVDEMLRAAGYVNFEGEPGWRTLPLERLAKEGPDLIASASFWNAPPDRWSAARHPIVARHMKDRPVVGIEGAWTACGGWFLVDAVEALAQARTEPRRR